MIFKETAKPLATVAAAFGAQWQRVGTTASAQARAHLPLAVSHATAARCVAPVCVVLTTNGVERASRAAQAFT